ncbi:prolyl 4-hydroxylase subunit alpha-3-like [Ostrea edulis]|uniref:prolyl 4-hydroxylase subunit alpha-3-like n=1 Tax=Ostrea edulis TaxID=37623 RepID=UPI0024AEDDE2|nr:prolyl 4-hydroxylase subunit alpha-3-like [Ostrea edulis]
MEDVNGAMTGLLHVWSVYQQDADDVMAGIMFGMPSKPLSSEDMLILAEHARKFKFFVEEIALRQEYLKRVQLEGKERIKFISKIAQAYHNIKMSKAAGKILSPFLLTDYRLIKPRLIKYETEARHEISSTDTLNIKRTLSGTEQLCQSETKTSKEQSKLYCTLRRTEIPYYVVKEEVLHVRPRVLLFHDVISDDDIRNLKKTTIQQLYSPSEIYFNDAGMTIYQLKDRKFKRLSDKLSRRMSRITGLSNQLKPIQTDAENFQVIHYGPGGRLPEISDCRTESLWTCTEHDQLPLAPYVRYSGDNIATWITFLNDVKEGGATIMPALKVRVPAVKGAALFFYNYKRSGDCDLRTQYRTCPVALGTRWDAVKLIKQGGQVFRRLCDTSMDSKDD